MASLASPASGAATPSSTSAAGTQEAPGKRVLQKAGLNRSILDQGWSLFKNQLGYKLEWRGGELVHVNPAYTSQRCHACGHTHTDNRKGEAFRCRACGHADHADVNAAKNILAAGHAVLAGRNPRPSRNAASEARGRGGCQPCSIRSGSPGG